jgi:hypothetical protein
LKESLISEPIEPVMEDAGRNPFTVDRVFEAGEPFLPTGFRWRGTEYRIEQVLEAWKEYTSGTKQMPERYLRKHWFRVRVDGGLEVKIYFERHVRSAGSARARWWLFTIVGKEVPDSEPPDSRRV